MRHRNSRRRTRRGLALVVAATVLAACGGAQSAEPKRRRRPPATTTSTTIAIPRAPLTGLPDPSGVGLARPSLSVKIENTPEARPQSGLDLADIVYEEVVEGGITRFWAIFNSAAPETVGPIRSVRAMDPLIVSSFGGVVAYSGGATVNVQALRAAPVTWVDEANAADSFFRERSRPAPHNLYGRTALLWQRGGQPVPPTPHFSYLSEGAAFAGEPIAQFRLGFRMGYDVTYVWDGALGGWRRIQGVAPFVSTSLAPIAPTNVVVQFVPYFNDGEGALIGEGDAWIFSAGQLVRGRWSKPNAIEPTHFVDGFGIPIPLTPGRTWVELFPTGQSVDLVPGPPPIPPSTTTTSTTTPKRKKKEK